MLVTNTDHELVEYPFRKGQGARAWRAVSLELRVPYVFISYACKQGRIWMTQSTILWRDDDVVSVCQELKAEGKRKILQIALLFPPDEVEFGEWHMRQVREIWTGHHCENRQRTVIYLGMAGEWMVTFAGPTEAEKIDLRTREYCRD